jgi:hypothetical protein
MAREQKFFLTVMPEKVVGPHALNTLREAVYFDVIPRDALVCEDGKQTWHKMSGVPGFLDFPRELKKQWSSYQKPDWWSDSVTEKQIAKLDYFGLPYSRKGLTKGRASQLIDWFARIDPECEKQYQDRPATAEQKRKLRALGGDSGSKTTYSEARDLIEELELDKRLEDQDEEVEMMCLENSVNDEDWRELLGYKKLNQKQLKTLARYLKDNPQFKDADRERMAEIIIELFPDRAAGSGAGSHRRARGLGSGTVIFLVVVVAVLLGLLKKAGWLAPATSESKPQSVSPVAAPTPATVQTRATPLPASAPVLAPNKGTVQPQPHVAPSAAESLVAQKRAIAIYPALGVAGSPLNREFVIRHNRYKTEKPDFFTDPEWPTKLAAECAQALGAVPR